MKVERRALATSVLFLASTFLGLTASPSVLIAQTASPDAATAEMRQQEERAEVAISRLRSPFCPGFMLDVCTSPQAAVLRDTIRAWAATGMDVEAMTERMIAEYGEEYRAFPKTSGKGLLAWLAPPIAFLIGLLAVVAALRRLRAGAPPPATVVTVADEARVREAMEELERAEGPVA